MKPNLLKPNKISFSHQQKTHNQTKLKSTRPSTLLDSSSLHHPIPDKLLHKKNHHTSQHNKENQLRNIQSKQKNHLKNIEQKQPKNVELKQPKNVEQKQLKLKQKNQVKNLNDIREKKESQARLRKPSQLYITEKISRMSRNKSMYINSQEHHNQTGSSSRLSINHNSSINQNICINPKSSISAKEPHESIDKNESKSFELLQRKSITNKPCANLVRSNSVINQPWQDLNQDIKSNQSKNRNIPQNRKGKHQQTSRNIRRTKLSWLLLANTLYGSIHAQKINQKSKNNNSSRNIPTLFDLVHYLKNYQKNYHNQQSTLLNLSFQQEREEKITLTQLVKFFKIILTTNYIHTVWKQNTSEIDSQKTQITFNTKEIDSQKTQITFNTFGKIIFSHQSILEELKQENKHHLNVENPLWREEDEAVETARFQNNENHYQYLQEKEMERRHKKKSIIFKIGQEEVIYQHLNSVNKKPITSTNQQMRGGQNLSRATDQQSELFINQPVILDINQSVKPNVRQENKHSPSAFPNSKGSFLSSKPHQHRLTIQPNSGEHLSMSSIEQSAPFSLKNYNSSNQIEDISEILQTAENDKLETTEFQARYNTKQQSTFTDPFHDSSIIDQNLLFRKSFPNYYSSDYNTSQSLEQCKLQALNMDSSQLFLESVILTNLYNNNFNVSFSEQPLNDKQFDITNECNYLTLKENYSKLQDVVQEIQNIIHSLKNLFAFQQDSPNDHIQFFKNVIRLQDITQIEEFLSQFIDYKVFRKEIDSDKIRKDINQQEKSKKKDNKNNVKRRQFDSQESRNNNNNYKGLKNQNNYQGLRKDKRSPLKCEYFNAVKLTEGNLTSSQTQKTASEIVRSGLIEKYLSYFDAIRIYQAPSLIEHIEMLIGNSWNIKILNLSNNELSEVAGLVKVIGNNMNCLQFLNLSNNRITSLATFFSLLDEYKGDSEFSQLTQLHVKNNKIAQLSYNGIGSRQNQQDRQGFKSYHFPKLQLLDLRSNMIEISEILSIKRIVLESPRLSIMSIKQNPIMETTQKIHVQKFLNSKSIYEYDSLQMMSAYIKYKQITFTHSNQGCCSIIEIQPNQKLRQIQQNESQNQQISHQQITIH